MRVDRSATSISPLDRMADRILDQLAGYTRRQNLVITDRAYLRRLLEEWQSQVNDLQRQIKLTQYKIIEYERREISPLKRALNYLRFISGAKECPTL